MATATLMTGTIDTGPNSEKLHLAHRHKFCPEDFGLDHGALPNNGRMRLRFEIFGIRGSESWLIINTVSWEDGSGESWNLEGIIVEAEGCDVNWPFKAYYNSRLRKGQISFCK